MDHRLVPPGEGGLAGEGLVEDDPQGVDVRAVVQLLPLGLLRAHVHGGADPGPGDGEAGEDPARGDAEVHEAHPSGVHPVLPQGPLEDHDVPRLDVPVDDPLGVDVLQGVRHPGQDGRRLPKGEAPFLNELVQPLPVQKLHGDVVDALHLAVVVDLDDVGVVHAGKDLGLPVEAAHKPGVPEEALLGNLQGHQAARLPVLGLVDGGHPPEAHLLQDLVPLGEGLPLGRGPRRGGALRAWGPPLGPLPPPRAQVEAGGGEGPEQEKRPGGQGLRADPQGVPAPGEKAEEEGRGPGREADGQEGREEDEEGGEEQGHHSTRRATAVTLSSPPRRKASATMASRLAWRSRPSRHSSSGTCP